MIAKDAAHPNCMYMWMDHMMSAEANAQATIYFGEAPTSQQACDYAETFEDGLYAGHCEQSHATDEAYCEDVWYWSTPAGTATTRTTATTCKDVDDWVEAWTTIRGG